MVAFDSSNVEKNESLKGTRNAEWIHKTLYRWNTKRQAVCGVYTTKKKQMQGELNKTCTTSLIRFLRTLPHQSPDLLSVTCTKPIRRNLKIEEGQLTSWICADFLCGVNISWAVTVRCVGRQEGDNADELEKIKIRAHKDLLDFKMLTMDSTVCTGIHRSPASS